MFVVTGATGNVGRAVVDHLRRRGADVRAVVRDRARAQLPEGVDVAAGDLSDPGSLHDALRGSDGVFLLPGYPGVADAALRAGAARIVQLSGGSAGSGDAANAVTRYMTASEDEVRATGLPATFVRPTAYMSNALRWLPQLNRGDIVRLPFADVPIALVDPGDVAAVAAAALADPGHDAMVYRPTGPRALLPGEQVEILGNVLGRELRFEAQPNDAARREMLTDTPAPYVAAFFDFYVNGALDETTVRPTVADVTGDAPRTFAQWVETNHSRFPLTSGIIRNPVCRFPWWNGAMTHHPRLPTALPPTLAARAEGSVLVLTLDRPAKRNAIDDDTLHGIERAFTDLDPAFRAAVLDTAGEHFSAGLDLAGMGAHDAFAGMLHSRSWHRALDAVEKGPVPVVAALKGAVVGGGLELAAACHIRVADTTAFYALPEGQRGLFVGGGGSVRLPRLMGVATMTDLMLTGRRLDAEQGRTAGLSQYLVDEGTAAKAALDLAHRIADNAEQSNYAVLQALPRIAEADPEQGYLIEALMSAIAQSTPDAKRRMADFLAGRARKVTDD